MMVSLSGCTSDQITNENYFDGTWVGSGELTMMGGRANSSVSQLTFTEDMVELVLTSEQGIIPMNYTYTIAGDTVVLEPSFPSSGGFPGGQPFNRAVPPNGSQPPMNGSWSPNGTQPPMNGSWLPNGTRPNNGMWNPGEGRPSMNVSYTYSFNDNHSILYLNGVSFRKVQ